MPNKLSLGTNRGFTTFVVQGKFGGGHTEH
jgi:hypothetical protein